jgi:hypothetical protein
MDKTNLKRARVDDSGDEKSSVEESKDEDIGALLHLAVKNMKTSFLKNKKNNWL